MSYPYESANYQPFFPFMQPPVQYMMVEVNGRPTPIPVYSADHYHLPDTATNSPKPGETPEETERRKADEQLRSRIVTATASKKPSSYATYGAPQSHFFHQNTTYHPSFYGYEAPSSDASYSYSSTSQNSGETSPPYTPATSAWIPRGDHLPTQVTCQPMLTIDTAAHYPREVESSLSSALSYTTAQQSPWSPESRDGFSDQDSSTATVPPDTPSDLISPTDYLPPPSQPVDLLALPPRGSPSSRGSLSPPKSPHGLLQQQQQQYRPIHPRQDTPPESSASSSSSSSSTAVVGGSSSPSRSQTRNGTGEKGVTRTNRSKVTRTACRFCRGRKIACGPPPPGGDGHTCNQCLRRSLVCVYPEETDRSHRHRRQGSSGSRETLAKIGRPPKTTIEPRLPGEGEPIPVGRSFQAERTTELEGS